MSYKEKYLKYKNKYLDLKKKIGGNTITTHLILEPWVDEYTQTNISPNELRQGDIISNIAYLALPQELKDEFELCTETYLDTYKNENIKQFYIRREYEGFAPFNFESTYGYGNPHSRFV